MSRGDDGCCRVADVKKPEKLVGQMPEDGGRDVSRRDAGGGEGTRDILHASTAGGGHGWAGHQEAQMRNFVRPGR